MTLVKIRGSKPFGRAEQRSARGGDAHREHVQRVARTAPHHAAPPAMPPRQHMANPRMVDATTTTLVLSAGDSSATTAGTTAPDAKVEIDQECLHRVGSAGGESPSDRAPTSTASLGCDRSPALGWIVCRRPHLLSPNCEVAAYRPIPVDATSPRAGLDRTRSRGTQSGLWKLSRHEDAIDKSLSSGGRRRWSKHREEAAWSMLTIARKAVPGPGSRSPWVFVPELEFYRRAGTALVMARISLRTSACSARQMHTREGHEC